MRSTRSAADRLPRWRRPRLLWILLLGVLITSQTAAGFKIDTHIWIAQEVLNDALDGDVRFTVGRKTITISVPDATRRALQRHPAHFRLGSVGPDAFPDILVGQMVIHPGVTSGWGAADFLRHLHDTKNLTDEQRAFVLGNFVHVASDVFAHTYVNRYTGDVFSLTENPVASKRHIRLESFISSKTPPLRDSRGRLLGAVHTSVLDRQGRLAVPAEFVRDLLFFAPASLEQIQNSGHAGYVRLIRNLRRDVDAAIAPGGPVERIEILAVQVAAYLTLGVQLSEENAKKAKELADRIHSITNFSEESIQVVNAVDEGFRQLHVLTTDQLRSLFAATEQAVQGFLNEKSKLDGKRREIHKLRNDLLSTQEEIEESVVRTVCTRCPPISLLCRAACTTHTEITKIKNPARRQLLESIDRLESEVSALDRVVADRLKAVHNAAISAMGVITKAIDVKLALNKVLLQFFSIHRGESPLREFFRNWRNDIDEAMVRFVVANGESMVNTITPGKKDPLAPFREWFDCYGKGLVGIPILVTNGVCKVRDAVADFRAQLKEFEDNVTSIDPIGARIVEVKNQLESELLKIKDDLISHGTDELLGELDKLAKTDSRLWKSLFSETATPTDLNAEFGADASSSGLLLITDIAARVQTEMSLDGRGFFDPATYAVVKNSIVLSKLALLDQKRLSTLVKEAEVKQTIYGSDLYGGGSKFADNVLYGFAKNIDGNHQWHRLSPPHPRKSGYDAEEFERRRRDPSARYGYEVSGCSPERGMRMWVDPEARAIFFRGPKDSSLFTGPVPGGIDLPSKVGAGFPSLLTGYPNSEKVTETDPWASDGIDVLGGDLVTYRLNGRGRPGLTAVVALRSGVTSRVPIGPDGTWSLELTAPRSDEYSRAQVKQETSSGQVVAQSSIIVCSLPPPPRVPLILGPRAIKPNVETLAARIDLTNSPERVDTIELRIAEPAASEWPLGTRLKLRIDGQLVADSAGVTNRRREGEEGLLGILQTRPGVHVFELNVSTPNDAPQNCIGRFVVRNSGVVVPSWQTAQGVTTCNVLPLAPE